MKAKRKRIKNACCMSELRGSQDVELNNKRQKQKDAEPHILVVFRRLHTGHAAVVPI